MRGSQKQQPRPKATPSMSTIMNMPLCTPDASSDLTTGTMAVLSDVGPKAQGSVASPNVCGNLEH